MIKINRHGPIAIVSFDRGEKRNAFNQSLIAQLTDAAKQFHADLEVQAIVLTGTTANFSAGMDLDDEMWGSEALTDLERREIYYSGVRLCRAWEDLPQVTIAAIDGFAVGAGIALGLACDWRVLAEDAFLYVPEVKIGINLQWGALPRLITLVGPAKAKRICLLCEKLSARDALDWGLIDYVAEPASAVAKAVAIAEAVCEQPAVTVRMVKEAVNATANAGHQASAYADADQSQLSGQFAAAQSARKDFLTKK
jgi:enoyl-CoA hydratase